ncbi:CvpA family protein [Oribacterium sp. P6A1]|uniref:CvpA family protein n=1 Tax=Oribacterium sp. P6A1 TaxID=1410612 RepID=UPI0005660428|nr:CvpA family protein [Oribacterium sp. P6A1]
MTDIIEILKNDWLQISVVTFMVIMLIFGYYKGLIKMSSNLVSLILSVILTKSLRSYFQDWITNNDCIRTYVNTRIHENIANNVEKITETTNTNEIITNDSITSQAIKSVLEANNRGNADSLYELLGLDKITESIADKVTEFILSVITFIVLLIVITILIKILFKLLDKIAELPVLTAFNRISGSMLGLIESILYIWIFFIIISLLPQNDLVASAVEQMNREGTWIHFLKETNIFIKIFESIMS